jgi:hypothetical protein
VAMLSSVKRETFRNLPVWVYICLLPEGEMRNKPLCIFVMLLLTCSVAFATTTVEVEVTCPVCGTKNTFYDYASWGSYVYQWPSKYHYVFFPLANSTSLYQCKHCHLTLWLWDFKELKGEEKERVTAALKPFGPNSKAKSYAEIPMVQRLEKAEELYKLIKPQADKGNNEFWSTFYRTAAYHAGFEKDSAKAKEARTQALAFTELVLKEDPGRSKELLFVEGSLQHFLGDDAAALKLLDRSAAETYAEPGKDPQKLEGFNKYLTQLANDFAGKIRSGHPPTGYED